MLLDLRREMNLLLLSLLLLACAVQLGLRGSLSSLLWEGDLVSLSVTVMLQ